ncbi:hypothetical protein BJY04DRAFT_178642 [Aspergillus karnatakaensis]|uniref:uncharacterized protein n=1 Tax=Aspergillus karnatakaensis TaxID=1810916 RepID=UPI003CCD42C5
MSSPQDRMKIASILNPSLTQYNPSASSSTSSSSSSSSTASASPTLHLRPRPCSKRRYRPLVPREPGQGPPPEPIFLPRPATPPERPRQICPLKSCGQKFLSRSELRTHYSRAHMPSFRDETVARLNYEYAKDEQRRIKQAESESGGAAGK